MWSMGHVPGPGDQVYIAGGLSAGQIITVDVDINVGSISCQLTNQYNYPIAINFNGHSLNCYSFWAAKHSPFSPHDFGIGSLDITDSVITVQSWRVDSNVSVVATGSRINTKSFMASGAYNDLNFIKNNSTDYLLYSDNCSFNNVTMEPYPDGTTTLYIDGYDIYNNVPINGLVLSCNNWKVSGSFDDNFNLIIGPYPYHSPTIQFTINQPSGVVSMQKSNISMSIVTGGATFRAPLNDDNVNGGNNSGWDFTATPDVHVHAITKHLLLNKLAPSTSGGVSVICIYASLSSLVLSGFSPVVFQGKFAHIPSGKIILTAQGLIKIIYQANIPAAAMVLRKYDPSYTWTPIIDISILQKIYLCVLTDLTGLDDLIIPMSSFQATLCVDQTSYLACVIPNSINYISDIIAHNLRHTDGIWIAVKKGYRYPDGTINVEEICRVNYESLQVQRGAKNDSATISGHITPTYTLAKNRELTGVSYYGLQTDGKRSFRAELDLFLRVGDHATYNGDSIEVGQIDYTVDTSQEIMQVTEI